MTKDVVTITEATAVCEGNEAVSGHPRVYLTFKPGEKTIVCPYCSRNFVLAEGARLGHAH